MKCWVSRKNKLFMKSLINNESCFFCHSSLKRVKISMQNTDKRIGKNLKYLWNAKISRKILNTFRNKLNLKTYFDDFIICLRKRRKSWSAEKKIKAEKEIIFKLKCWHVWINFELICWEMSSRGWWKIQCYSTEVWSVKRLGLRLRDGNIDEQV